MKIKKTIACMALMISTGYSSLMTPREFEDNLNNAITGRYTFNGKESQEPGLNESFEYYRAVEGFTGNWFKRDKELLSLAIDAGKFGINTEFMWTLYNMASMGALRVDGIEEQINGSDVQRNNHVIEKKTEEEKPAPKVVVREQKPQGFSEDVWQSLTKKIKYALERDNKSSRLLKPITELSTFLSNLSNEELRFVKDNSGNDLSDKMILEKTKAILFLRDPIETDFNDNPDEFELAKSIADKVKNQKSGSFWNLLETFTHKELLLALSDNYKNAFVNCGLYTINYGNTPAYRESILKEWYDTYPLSEIHFKSIVFGPIKALAFLTDPIETDFNGNSDEFETAKGIAEKVKNQKSGSFWNLLETFTHKELLLALTDKYKNAFVHCKLYNNKPEYVHLLDIYDFKKPLPEIEALLNKIKAKAFLTDPILENFKGIELDIVKKIAEKMDNLSKTLKDELDLWDLAMVNFIAEKPGYKDAIIAYSKNYPYLKDNNSKPLTEDTFNQIVVSVLVGKANNKETLDEIKQNFSTVIAKNEILKKAIKEKEKNYK